LVLSIVVPVYNERYLAPELLRRLVALEIPAITTRIIVVDDGSTDGTSEVLRGVAGEHPDRITLLEQRPNQGKGAALRRGIAAADGDLIVFQDADLEYDPRDLARMVVPFLEDEADVVYGSRFLPAGRRRVLYFKHTLGNRFLTFLSDWFTDLNLSDIETCYKMFRSSLLKSIPIRSNDFAIEVELTAKVAKRGARIFEVPISYVGRTYREGKKIGWRDGFKALFAIVRFWLIDDLYQEDEYGSHILHNLEKAHRFNAWMADMVAASTGQRVLEIGAGIGNITQRLIPREHYVASDINPHYLHYLRNLSFAKPYLEVAHANLDQPADFEALEGRFDTVICLNVLEHVPDPHRALANMFRCLEPGGRLVLYVPRGPGLYSRLDEVLGHRCRYTTTMLRDELASAGFEIESLRHFNRSGVLGWLLNGKLRRAESLSTFQLKLYDMAIPLLRRLDRFLPWPGLGLFAVARK
jgi:glycosyltransferase involved in cell wall biosynthesis/phospholipid N-methyltransferase